MLEPTRKIWAVYYNRDGTWRFWAQYLYEDMARLVASRLRTEDGWKTSVRYEDEHLPPTGSV